MIMKKAFTLLAFVVTNNSRNQWQSVMTAVWQMAQPF
jgi:hypothetical protein